LTIIGVCGYSGAGKSTFCQEMARRFQLPVLSTGEIVRRRTVERGYPLTPESIARVSDEIRRETGGRFLLVLERDLAGLGPCPAVLVDCLREPSDLMALRDLSDRTALVAITATDEVRATRLLARGRPGDPTGRAGLLALDEAERRLGVERLLADAELFIGNDKDGLGPFAKRSAAAVERILAGV
jgi:ribose 1,5-bisphosphokinase PhnN